ncbi:hypothetical protein Xen7305DRAFT_00021860 [Xenococcus sp. PCC 7305]|uniref:hypothetical protein n=1 Tax=Xenococcus sp. PCC 7305 TaxID=102125 RepID=UPI0002ABE36B|nr:hypothetical protein [Xenococcus sp. PCC 7305]ELS02472.1 hypothetical protein Xen7305DRAFT_00021860 [Xenococcus sp. PCC 7305]
MLIAGCTFPSKIEANNEEKQNVDTSFCPVLESRNWHAWIDRVAEKEPRLNISGEVDLPSPGYIVEVQPGILDRRQPPAQRLSLSFTSPEGVVAQVITPTKVSYTMPTPILEYRSVMIYCGDKLLAEIPDVTPQETASLPIKVGTFTSDELFDAGGGGCGMTLWESKTDVQQAGFLFFHGIEDGAAFMVFDENLTTLSRTTAEGQEFYGQKTEQTFVTDDQAITVQVKVNLGAEGEIESVGIPNGLITVTTQGKTKEFFVMGDAGC